MVFSPKNENLKFEKKDRLSTLQKLDSHWGIKLELELVVGVWLKRSCGASFGEEKVIYWPKECFNGLHFLVMPFTHLRSLK